MIGEVSHRQNGEKEYGGEESTRKVSGKVWGKISHQREEKKVWQDSLIENSKQMEEGSLLQVALGKERT